MNEKDNYGYLDNQCICCGCTPKNDEWSNREKNLCIDCQDDS